jgi:hypothetical protein
VDEIMRFFYRVLFPTVCALAAWVAPAYAKEESGGSGAAPVAWYTWVLILFCTATAVLTFLYWLRRKKPEGRWLKALSLMAGMGAVLMGGFNASGMWQDKETAPQLNLIHIQGLSYENNGGKVLVATQDGIKWYDNGVWSSGEGERMDYMGFAPFDGGFYSSGHPEPGSKLENPIGLVKSTDEGKSVQVLSLHGQVNFHLLAASYRNQTVYAYNPNPNEGLKQAGLYWTKDEGKTWTKCAMGGFVGEPTTLAVHPDNASLIAVGSRDGLFLSNDQGKTFEKLLPDTGISALSFDRNGQLTVGGFKVKPSLLQLDPVTRKMQEIPLPELKEDAIAFTSHNPAKLEERMITTYDQDVFLTTDGGATWSKLAENGKTKRTPELMPKAEKKSSS